MADRRRVTARLRFWARTAVVCLAAASLPGLLGDRFLWADLSTHFRPHYLAAAVPLTGALVLLRSPRWSVAAGVLLVINGALVAPLSFGGDPRVPEPPRLRILLANVQMENPDHRTIAALADERRADVVALLEVDGAWTEDLRPLEERFPHRHLEPRPDRFGIALYSRHPFEAARTIRFGRRGAPSIEATLRAHGRRVTVVATHPPPPVGDALFRERNAELAALGEHVAGLGGAVVMVGDLNVTPWSPPYGKALAASGLLEARQGFGTLGTWPAPVPWPFRVPIDHAWVTPDLPVVDVSVGPAIGSDHRPLVLTVSLAEAPEGGSSGGG